MKRAIRLLRRALFGRRNGTEIDLVRAALRRHEAVVDEMSDRWARARMPCCPSCAFGSSFTEAVDQAERTRGWLAVLLTRRARPEDLREARGMLFDGVPEHVRTFVRSGVQVGGHTDG